MAQLVSFGPRQMGLGLELLRVLTAGDTDSLVELLRREEQTNGHVAITVQDAVAPGAVTARPPPGRSCLLDVASNGNTALHLAASRGHAELAAFICDRAPSLVATRNKCLDTPLHCAAKTGSRDVAAILLATMRAEAAAAEMALRGRNRTGATALYEAVRHGRAAVVDQLMTEAPELASLATEDGFSPLYLAASTDCSDMVQALLRPSRDGTPSPASFSGPEGRTALHVAAASIKEIPREILKWEPVGPTLLNKVDSAGRTPLHYAVLYRRLDVVELFLDGDISDQVRISDNHGLFPLHYAAKVGSTKIIDVLIQKCPDYYELVDDKGINLLHCAVEHNQETVVRDVCQNGKFVMLLNAMDFEGNTPLHLAVKYGRPRIVSLLLQTAIVRTDITNKDGLTARDLGHRALERERINYFLNPHHIVFNCMRWSGATTTTSVGFRPVYVDKKHTYLFQKETKCCEGEAFNEEGSLGPITKDGIIASVLIATVAFAAAFTVPGGFVADDHPSAGTAILVRRFAFRAFVVSDTMAFVCSTISTCFLIYGGATEISRNHRFWYNVLASALVPVAAQFMIAAFAYAFHLVLGDANRGLIVFVYLVCLATVLFCFPVIWVPLQLGLAKAVWRRAGWRGLVNVHERPSSQVQLFWCLTTSLLFQNLRRPLFVLLISASFIVAIALNIALPNY